MNNQITLIGRVGQAPSQKSFAQDSKIIKFSLAVQEFSSNNDEKKVMWIDVDAWNGLGDRVMQCVTKGREVAVTGRLTVAKWKKNVNGVEVEMVKPVVKLTSFHLCGAKPKDGDSSSAPAAVTRKPKLAALA